MREILTELQPALIALLEALAAVGIAQLTLYLRHRYKVAQTERLQMLLASITADAVAYVDQTTKARLGRGDPAPTSASKLESALLYVRRQAAQAGIKLPDKEYLIDLIETALGYLTQRRESTIGENS